LILLMVIALPAGILLVGARVALFVRLAIESRADRGEIARYGPPMTRVRGSADPVGF
jgi:hypothetical protein